MIFSDEMVYEPLIDHFSCSLEDLHTATTLCETINQLDALLSVMTTHGMSKELLAFADHDLTLSTAISTIPSLEAYVADPDVLNVDAAAESVLQSIKHVSQRFIDAIMSHIVRFRNWYGSATKILGAFSIAILNKGKIKSVDPFYLAGQATFDWKILLDPKVVVPAVAAGAVLIALNLARSTPHAIKQALELTLPTDVQGRAAYISKVSTIFQEVAKIDLKRLGVATLSERETGKSARELGYTKEHVEEIVRDVSIAIDELRRCEFIPEKLETLSRSVEATTSNGKAALIFLTNVITKTMHLAVHDTLKAGHQMQRLDIAVRHVEHTSAIED